MRTNRLFFVAASTAVLLANAHAAEPAQAMSPAAKASAPAGKTVKSKAAIGADQKAGTGQTLNNMGDGSQGSTIKPIPKPKLDPKEAMPAAK